VAATLAAGLILGAALGPGPASSPADGSTLAQRALAALMAQTRSSSQPSTPASQATSPVASKAGTAPATKPTAHKVESKQSVPSSEASTPSSPSESSSSSESATGNPSEGSSNESSSGKDSPSKGAGKSNAPAPGTQVKLPPIKHVWVIALSEVNLGAALADPNADPYLAKQLAPKGALLSDFTLSASSALGNGIALLSGQSVNLDTEQNCPSYIELQPPEISAASGLAEGVGCVYPAAVKTLPDELTAAGLTWKAYVQGMATSQSGSGTPTQPATPLLTCRHPEPGATDPNHAPLPGDPYLSFRNPFVYFHSLLDGGACASNDVDLAALQGDLTTPASTPSFSWIAPSACNDGSGTPCTPGAAAGLGPADALLKEAVGQILATAAYREGGLIAIVPDSAPATPASAASKPAGALLLSPFVRGGAHVSERFNDFSLLKSLTRLFGVLPLGHANDPSATSFGATVYRTTK
jgi:hypothetical protein